MLGDVITDTCTCAGLNQDWNVSMADYCIINDDCDLGTGELTFYNEGNFTCNAEIDTTNMGNPGNGGTLYVGSSCMININ